MRNNIARLLGLSMTFMMAAAQTGCASNDDPKEDPALTLAQTGDIESTFRILEVDMEPSERYDDVLIQRGRYVIANGDSSAHSIRVHIQKTVSRGALDTQVDIVDETSGNNSVYSLNDEMSTVQMQTVTGSTSIVVNPDQSYTIDDVEMPLASDAANYLQTAPVMDTVSPESVIALAQLVGGDTTVFDEAGRGAAGPVLAVAHLVWVVTSAVVCNGEYRRKSCNLYALSSYCRSWCSQAGCRC